MSLIIAMAIFSLSMSISPGPVNMVTLSTGANYGFTRAMAFVSGATIGFTLLLFVVGIGVGEMISSNQTLLHILGVGGTGFICYLGFKIFTSDASVEFKKEDIPTFGQGFILQWMNPKAWGACLSGITAFSVTGSYSKLLLFLGIYFVICYLSIASWAFLGVKLKPLVKSTKNIKLFNMIMGSGLIVVGLYLLVSQLGLMKHT